MDWNKKISTYCRKCGEVICKCKNENTMEKQEIENGNEIIKAFVGKEFHEKLCYQEFGAIDYSQCKGFYNDSWNWLMAVVEKIAEDYDFRITWMPTAMAVTYIDRPDVSEGEITSMGGMTAIENTFVAVVRFIEWYNTKSVGRKK